MKSANWLVIIVYVVFQLSIIGLQITGPFFDESIYTTAGLRTLEGDGLTDNYMTWFIGTLLWPTIAGLLYNAGGLVGVRLAATFFATIALIGISEAVKNIYNSKVSFWTTLLLSINGSFMALSHLGVYDLPALAGISLSF